MVGIVLAGGIPDRDHPLYSYTDGLPKAMIDIEGRPMLAHVVGALLGSNWIQHVVVVGLPPEIILDRFDRTMITYLPDSGSLVQNGAAGLRWVREAFPDVELVVGCSADIPHLRAEMVDAMIEACHASDALLHYGLVPKGVVESRYPGAKRTYIRFKGNRLIAPADLFVSRVDILDSDHALLEKITQARKHPFQIARLVGFGLLLKLALGRLSLEEAAAAAGRLLGSPMPIGLYESPFAEIAMDGDKPHQIDLLRRTFPG